MKRANNDAMFTLYWWKGLFNYKAEFLGDFSLWTLNNNRGDDFTKNLSGNTFYFFAEPQFWYNLNKTFAFGTKINLNFHVLTTRNVLQVYPTIGLRCKL